MLVLPESDWDGRKDTPIQPNTQAWETGGAAEGSAGRHGYGQASTGQGVHLPTAQAPQLLAV